MFLEGVRRHGRDAKSISRDMGNRTIGAVKKYYKENRTCARLFGAPLLPPLAEGFSSRWPACLPASRHMLAQLEKRPCQHRG